MNTEFPNRNISPDPTTSVLNKSTEAINEFTKALENLTKTIGGSSTTGTKKENRKETTSDDSSNENNNKPSAFKTKVVAGFTAIKDVIKSSFRALGDLLNGLADTVGGAIGSVFGSGLIGNMIAKAVTKGITGTIGLITGGFKKIMKGVFSMGKMLVSGIISNLPQIAFYGAIIAAVGTIVFLLREFLDDIRGFFSGPFDAVKGTIKGTIDGVRNILPKWLGGKEREQYGQVGTDLKKILGVTDDEITEHYKFDKYGSKSYEKAYSDWESISSGDQVAIEKLKASFEEERKIRNDLYQKNLGMYENLNTNPGNPKIKALQNNITSLYIDTAEKNELRKIEATNSNDGLNSIQNAPVNIAVEHNNSVLNNNLSIQTLSADNPQIYSTTNGFGSSQSIMR